MITIEAEGELSKLNASIRKYIEESKKTPQAAVLKQALKLTFALRNAFNPLSPARGSITSTALAGLQAKRGVHVRPSIRLKTYQKYHAVTDVKSKKTRFGKKQVGSVLYKGKRLNLQALAVRAELAVREKGIGFLGLAAKMPNIDKLPPGKLERWFGRFHQELAAANLSIVPDGAGLNIVMGSDQSTIGEGLQKPEAQRALATALRTVRDDIEVYIRRKASEDAKKVGLA